MGPVVHANASSPAHALLAPGAAKPHLRGRAHCKMVCLPQAAGGMTVLLQALRYPENREDAEETVRLLLQAGADPNAPVCEEGIKETRSQPIPPLAYTLVREWLSKYRQPEVMSLLLEAGADPNPTFEWEGAPTRLLDLALKEDYGALLLSQLIPRLHLGGLPARSLQAMFERLMEG